VVPEWEKGRKGNLAQRWKKKQKEEIKYRYADTVVNGYGVASVSRID